LKKPAAGFPAAGFETCDHVNMPVICPTCQNFSILDGKIISRDLTGGQVSGDFFELFPLSKRLNYS
jgi:hypothetical protein